MAFAPELVDEKPKRWWLRILIVVVVLLGLLVIVAFAADPVIRSIARDRVATEVAAVLPGVSADSLDVEVGGGPMVLQLVAGRLDQVDVSSESVDLGGLVGRAEVTARGIPLDQSAATDSLAIDFIVDEEQLGALSANLSGLPISSVTTEGDELAVAIEFEVFGQTIPLGISIEPAASDGQLAFTPTSISLAEATVSVDRLRSLFGSVAESALATQNLCIAQYLPSALTLDSVTVEPGGIRLGLSAADVALGGTGFSTMGACAAT